jgi:hypothetical protein
LKSDLRAIRRAGDRVARPPAPGQEAGNEHANGKDVKRQELVFLPRPPELISLAGLGGTPEPTLPLVFPDPPLGAEEQRLFEIVAPKRPRSGLGASPQAEEAEMTAAASLLQQGRSRSRFPRAKTPRC